MNWLLSGKMTNLTVFYSR